MPPLSDENPTHTIQSDYSNSPPYLLTFATSDVCTQWWALVQREYPESTRPGAQLFVLKNEDMQALQDDPKFSELRGKWFFTSQDRSNCATPVIPLQGATGHLVSTSRTSPAYSTLTCPPHPAATPTASVVPPVPANPAWPPTRSRLSPNRKLSCNNSSIKTHRTILLYPIPRSSRTRP